MVQFQVVKVVVRSPGSEFDESSSFSPSHK